jgi:hypothetical protein
MAYPSIGDFFHHRGYAASHLIPQIRPYPRLIGPGALQEPATRLADLNEAAKKLMRAKEALKRLEAAGN